MNDTDFIGEIRYFAFDFVPEGWLRCDGSELRIAEYQALAAVIGIAFGGDGRNTFKLPDLRGRAAIDEMALHVPPYKRGQVYGLDTVTLMEKELPPHTHQMVRPGGGKPFGKKVSAPGATTSPGSLALADESVVKGLINTGAPNTQLLSTAVTRVGAGQPHTNLQPYQVFSAGICHDGIYPSPQ